MQKDNDPIRTPLITESCFCDLCNENTTVGCHKYSDDFLSGDENVDETEQNKVLLYKLFMHLNSSR